MIWWIVGIVVWLAFGIFTWGWAYAYFANKYPELEKDSPIPYAFMSLLGPINFIGFLFGVCVYDKKWYGWRLW